VAISLRARIVFPVDRPAIEYGVVTIDGERIVEIGADSASGTPTDLGIVALLPGLVNAHTHLEFSDLSRPLGDPGMPLVDWIRLVIAHRGRRDASQPSSTAVGLRESLSYGVTTIGEIATTVESCQAADHVTSFLEVIGFSRARVDSVFAATLAGVDDMQRSHARGRVGISPHAPYTVSLQLLRQLVGLVRQRDLPIAMHVAESGDELEFVRMGSGPFQQLLEERSMWDADAVPRGSRPLDYLRLLAEAPRSLVIHGNYLDDEERDLLAAERDRMSLIYCPRTHAYFGHAPFPLASLLGKGVNVALGTDSRASSPDLNLLAEMRRVFTNYSELDPLAVLRMGTLCGARALGRVTEIGSLTPGKLANLVAVPLPDDIRGKPRDLLGAMLADDHNACRVWLHGLRM
jgi:cytosine/adenosine deaminase-related metal-dependent hydrolase